MTAPARQAFVPCLVEPVLPTALRGGRVEGGTGELFVLFGRRLRPLTRVPHGRSRVQQFSPTPQGRGGEG